MFAVVVVVVVDSRQLNFSLWFLNDCLL